MFRARVIRRTLSCAASLLSVVALVLALLQAGAGALAASVVPHPIAQAHETLAQDDCTHHAAHHTVDQDVAHNSALVAVFTGSAEADPEPDPAQHPHTHPCCVSAVAVVLPLLAAMPLPMLPGGPKLMGDVAERLEARTPEGPAEPPRTADMS